MTIFANMELNELKSTYQHMYAVNLEALRTGAPTDDLLNMAVIQHELRLRGWEIVHKCSIDFKPLGSNSKCIDIYDAHMEAYNDEPQRPQATGAEAR